MAEQFKLRMPPQLRHAIERSARQRGVSLNTEICDRLEQTVSAEDQVGGPAMRAITNMLAGAYLRGGQLGAAAQGHPEWTPEQWSADPVCHRAASYMVIQALGLPLQMSAPTSDPAAVHELLSGWSARGIVLRAKDGDKE